MLGTVVILLGRGSGKTYTSWVGLEDCGLGYWAINVAYLALSCIVTLLASHYAKQQQEDLRGKVASPSKTKVIGVKKSMLLGFLAGTAGSIGGLSGAIVPVWMKLGLDKEVARASAGIVILVPAFCSLLLIMITESSLVKSVFEITAFWMLMSFIAWTAMNLIEHQLRKRLFMVGTVIYVLQITSMGIWVFLMVSQMATIYSSRERFASLT